MNDTDFLGAGQLGQDSQEADTDFLGAGQLGQTGFLGAGQLGQEADANFLDDTFSSDAREIGQADCHDERVDADRVKAASSSASAQGQKGKKRSRADILSSAREKKAKLEAQSMEVAAVQMGKDIVDATQHARTRAGSISVRQLKKRRGKVGASRFGTQIRSKKRVARAGEQHKKSN